MSTPLLLSFCTTLFVTHGLSPIIWKVLMSQERMEQLGSKKPHLETILASSLHAIVAVLLNGYSLSTGELSVDTVMSKSYLGTLGMHMTLGYSAADFISCLLDKHMRSDIGILLHHLAMIAGITMGLYHGRFNFFVVYRLLSEFSTPWVNLWWTMHNFKIKGKFYIFTSIMMVITFFLCRVFVIPWHTYALQMALHSPPGLQVLWYLKLYMFVNYTIFDILNAYWLYKMLNGAYKVFCVKKTRTS